MSQNSKLVIKTLANLGNVLENKSKVDALLTSIELPGYAVEFNCAAHVRLLEKSELTRYNYGIVENKLISCSFVRAFDNTTVQKLVRVLESHSV